MGDDYRILRFLMIVFFGGAVAAIGANDIHRKYADREGREPPDAAQLVRELHGDVNLERAQLAREEERGMNSQEAGQRSLLNRIVADVFSGK